MPNEDAKVAVTATGVRSGADPAAASAGLAAKVAGESDAPDALDVSRLSSAFDPLLLGLGLLLAWQECIPRLQSALGIQYGMPNAPAIVHACFFLLLAIVSNVRHGRLFSTRLALFAGGAVMLGSFLGLATGWGISLLACSVVGMTLEGFGKATLFLMWVEQYASRPQRITWPAFSVSFALVSLFYFVTVAVPLLASVIIMLVALAASCCMLVLCGRNGRSDEARSAETTGRAWKVPWYPAVLTASFAFAHYMLMHLAGGATATGYLGCLIVALLLLFASTAFFDRFNPRPFFRVCPPVIVAALLLYVQRLWPLADVAGLLSYAGYDAFVLLLYFILIGISFRYGVHAVWLFGVVEGIGMLAHVAGSFVGAWLAALPAEEFATVDAVVDVVVIVLVLLSALLLSERGLSSSWGLAPMETREVRTQAGAKVSGDAAEKGKGSAKGAPTPEPMTMGYYEAFIWRCSRVAQHYGLTRREEEVLSLLAQEKSLQDIETTLFISHNTVKGHVQHVYAKLGVHSREEAAALVRDWR
jgi:DNA-binding CsgD family transcriptional regulator